MKTITCPHCGMTDVPVSVEETLMPVPWQRPDGRMDACGRLHEITSLYPHTFTAGDREWECRGDPIVDVVLVDERPVPCK